VTRILITGAGGLLGSNLAFIASKTHAITAATHHYTGPLPGMQRLSWDLMDLAATAPALDLSLPEVIIHCAALTNVDACESDPVSAHRIHVESTARIAEWTRQHGAKLVYISTDAVFDGCHAPYAESDLTKPLNVYARTKWEGEQVALESDPAALIVRTNMFGWNLQNKRSLSEWFLDTLKRGAKVQGFTDVVFSPLLVNDLSRWILRLIERKAAGIFHLGAQDHCSKYDFGCMIAELFNFPKSLVEPVSIEGKSFAAARPKNTTLNSHKAADLIGEPFPTVREGLQAFKALHDAGYVALLRSGTA